MATSAAQRRVSSMNVNWVIVVLDAIIIGAWLSLAFMFSGSFQNRKFTVISVCFFLSVLGMAMLLLGDTALALGYNVEDHWVLKRAWRAVPWRCTSAVCFWVTALVMRFGNFNGSK